MGNVLGQKFRSTIIFMVFGLVLIWLPADVAAENNSAAAKNSANITSKKATFVSGKKSKEDQAIDLVFRRSDVKAWLKQFPGGSSKLGGHASATADHDKGDIYSVHVYEDFSDHTATFNWYNVNMKTGKITKQF